MHISNPNRFLTLLMFAIFSLCMNAHVFAAEKTDRWTFNLKEVDVRAFVEQVSSITGENFVVDPQVKGKVTVVAAVPANVDAVNELFMAVMRVNGYTTVSSGKVTRIVPQAANKFGGVKGGNQQMVTRVITLKNANVDETVKILKPLMSPSGYMEGSVFSNAIVVSDYADNVDQLMQALSQLDKESDGEVEVVSLKETQVSNIVPLIEALAPSQLAEAGGKSRNRLKVVADEQSNSIIIKGDKAQRASIRKLVEKFDQPTQFGNDIQLIKLKFADARQVAALLRGVVLNEKKDTQGAGAQPAIGAGANPNANEGFANLFSAANQQVNPMGANSLQDTPLQEDITTVKSFVQADVALNALVVKAEPRVMNEIRRLVSQLDVRRPQVLIEAAIVEITSGQLQQLGVQWGGGDVSRTFNAGTTQFTNGGGLNIGALLTQLNSANAAAIGGEGAAIALGMKNKFNVLIQALASTSGVNLLSTPSITTLDNEEAKIVVGQNVPFRTGSFTTLNSGVTNPFTTIERQDVGVTLKVAPQIHEGNLVRLNIQQEVSSIATSAGQTNASAADLITNKRTIQTKVLAEDGETVVLGGLMEDGATDNVEKVPILGDIPIIDTLFTSKSQSVSKRNLLVFLRPTVLKNREDMANAVESRYGRLYELQLNGKTPPADAVAPAPEAVFNPTPKTLPWLIQ